MARTYKRSRYLIATGFQLRFVGLILLFMVGTAIVSAFTIYYYIWMLLGDKLANVYPQGRLVQILNSANIALAIRMFIIMPFVAVLAVFLSHRIAGPLYRIKKTIQEVAAGDYSMRLRLRKTDELQDLADEINKLLEVLDQKNSKKL